MDRNRPRPKDRVDRTVVELGEDPPLSADGGVGLDRRRVSARWLAGTILTAATSVVLMGGALVVALQGATDIAAAPTPAAENALPRGGGKVVKTDRIRLREQPEASRQILHFPTVTRIGDRDLVRMQPFVKVSADLQTRKTVDTARIGAFNPLSVFSDTEIFENRAEVANPTFYGSAIDGEVVLKTRDFPPDSGLFDSDVTLTSAEVENVVAQQSRFLADGASKVAVVPAAPANPFASDRFEFGFAPQAGGALSALNAVRVIPENVSSFAKTFETVEAGTPGTQDPGGDGGGTGLDEKVVVVGANDSFKGLLREANATEKEATDIVAAVRKAIPNWKGLDVGVKLRLGMAKIEEKDDKPKPIRVSLYGPAGHMATVALDDAGSYVVAAEPDIADFGPVDVAAPDSTDIGSDDAPTLYQSLHQTALAQSVPRELIGELVRIYSFDVDFNSRVRAGDSFEVFYGLEDENDPASAKEILYAAIEVRGQERRYYRYKTGDDGQVDYYDDQGKSAKKFLMRKPMDGGEFRSGFGGRRHPILRSYRMHTGVDWAAPPGTPIFASGNGTIEQLGWKAGYGRYIRIQHLNGYETAYAHMLNWGRGLKEGDRVRQGQIIGYVGSSGMSTGPHLHYEVLINEVHVDPMRVRLPRGRELSGRMLAEFQKERERIDALFATRAGQRVAQTTN